MTIPVATIVSRAQSTLEDTGATRWSQAELIDWLNEAQLEIATLKLDANVATAVLTLVVGPKQTLPGDAIQLMRLTCNVANDGTTRGDAIRPTTFFGLDSVNPSWQSLAATGTVKNYVYEDANPGAFYVYPPAIAGTKVEAQYAQVPTTAVNGGNITLADEYGPAVLDGVLYRAYMKNIEVPGIAEYAARHRALFEKALSLGAKA